ncbi:DUF2244 domain-containing protein [Haliea sp. E1-2-M8]|uniref:DUF2244 domain-containing protein n=1 Tax=Haliea sp. E1-2-M8 TaxID=3064706 RepID=UPI002724A8FA|nr:DUF2244 domain-containing protein [Haliea sp. E1-2-M8]MDO8862239.1 DUF2244 domain-containing protein [Haliea sp. E1-2-M8]
MVIHSSDGNTVTIVAKPNQSATWRSNMLVLLALSVPSLGAAIGFALAGAWPILPFAGLELTALGGSLYYVNWKLQYRHVITFAPDAVQIDKGFYLPSQSWSFARDATGLSIEPERHPWDAPGLCLQCAGERISVGEFLNREDGLALQQHLRQELRVLGYGERASHAF